MEKTNNKPVRGMKPFGAIIDIPKKIKSKINYIPKKEEPPIIESQESTKI